MQLNRSCVVRVGQNRPSRERLRGPRGFRPFATPHHPYPSGIPVMTRTSKTRVASLIALFGLAALLGLVAFPVSHEAHAGLPPSVDGQALPSLAPMIERVTPAVVNINTRTRVAVRDPFFDDPFFRRFFNMPNQPRERVQQSLGSGVIVDAAKGYVLTNNHVIQGADDIEVTLHDKRTLKAQVIGSDPATDLTVLKIPVGGLEQISLAKSSDVRVGDFVVAIGDPFGLGQTVTSGIVSALDRTGLRGGYQSFIQTDASINPGNSGGALVNLRGELVGINSMIFSPSGASVGIGFAIPSDLAANVMRQLIQFGEVRRGVLGVETQDLTAELAGMLGITKGSGAVVTRVRGDSAAASAGLQPGDVIVAVNEKTVSSGQDLHNIEGLSPLGAALNVRILRDGKPQTVSMTLKASASTRLRGGDLDARLAGIQLQDLTDAQRQNGLAGSAVTAVEGSSRAYAQGLRAGDVIVAINQREFESTATLADLLQRKPRQMLLTILRGQSLYYLLLE